MTMGKEQKREGLLKINYEHLKSMSLTLFATIIASLFLFIVNFKELKDGLNGVFFILWLCIIGVFAFIATEETLKAYKELKRFYSS